MIATTAVDSGKAVIFYPVLAGHRRRTAVAYVATMIYETALMSAGALALLMLLPLHHAIALLGEGPAHALVRWPSTETKSPTRPASSHSGRLPVPLHAPPALLAAPPLARPVRPARLRTAPWPEQAPRLPIPCTVQAPGQRASCRSALGDDDVRGEGAALVALMVAKPLVSPGRVSRAVGR